jgi:hypothetical protein
MASGTRPVAVVTGASSGIGAASARRLAADGYDVVLGARRLDRLEEIAAEIGGRALVLDVTSPESVRAFEEAVPAINVLVNNAGGALGLERVADADEDHWRGMYETNVLGTMRLTKAFLPKLEQSGNGHIVTITSIAAVEVYPGGAGYTAAKHAQKALSETLRLELLGKPIRVTEIAPGLVETEFSLVRFDGDSARASKVYEGMTPLTADDIADTIAWAVTRPAHVNIDFMIVRPLAQATATLVHRSS